MYHALENKHERELHSKKQEQGQSANQALSQEGSNLIDRSNSRQTAPTSNALWPLVWRS